MAQLTPPSRKPLQDGMDGAGHLPCDGKAFQGSKQRRDLGFGVRRPSLKCPAANVPGTSLSMHLLFLDESGKIDQGGLFALGGVAVRDADWPALRDLWQQTLRDAGWPLDREVKWHGIRKGEVP